MHRSIRAFTLIELLVVISIMGLLIGILLPALGVAREVGRQCRGMSDLRQIMQGYTTYTVDRRGQLLYGYAPGSVRGETLTIRDGEMTYGPPVVNRYPWRLVPYVANVWDVLYSHTDAPPKPGPGDSESDAFMKAYMLSISPTFGINSVYVGGHFSPFYKGFLNEQSTAVPNAGAHVVFKESEVDRPSGLIAFAEVQRQNGGAEGGDGHFWATPPRAAGHMWRATGGTWEVLETSRLMGLPMGRYRNKTLTAFVDGHVRAMGAADLDDMTLWANDAKDNRYDVP